jgi:phosphatidylserine decarboxylase
MIHKEGYSTLLVSAFALAVICGFVYFFAQDFFIFALIPAILLFIFLLSFFRNPLRHLPEKSQNLVYAPADGKVVVVEESFEPEFLQANCIQVSIFMSPLNVHVNRNPISGIIEYYKYHPGKYLVAWHPKSSTENERTTIVYGSNKGRILMRQIAGFLARRVVCYAEIGQQVEQGEDIGFIKFGSRVDLYFPLGTEICVKPGDITFGNKSVIAKW